MFGNLIYHLIGNRSTPGPAPATSHLKPTTSLRFWRSVGFSALLLSSFTGCATVPATLGHASYDRAPLVGAYVPAGFWNDLSGLRHLEQSVGGRFDIGHWYTSWDYPYDPEPVDDLLAEGRIPVVSWQSLGTTVGAIADGAHDDYIRNWARQAAAAPGVLYVRPFPEMNGDWVPWHGDPEGLKAAWRHLARIFDEEGASNVRWVFSPNVRDEPNEAWNAMENYYPGHEYVDVLALDGYNWGSTRSHIGWRSFEDIFAEGYDRIVALGPQPFWVAEVASAERGGDKGRWIQEMLASTSFGRLEAIIWFNEDKEADWRIESSRGSLEAFRGWFGWRASLEQPPLGVSRAALQDDDRIAEGAQ